MLSFFIAFRKKLVYAVFEGNDISADNPFLDPRQIRGQYRFITQYKGSDTISKVRYGDIEVSYLPQLDGGGRDFGQDFIPVVRSRLGKVGRICEFGCGPGFIGFSLLAHGLCDSLCLIDVNPEAVKMVRRTIKENHLEGKVSVYLSDGLKSVPQKEKWDLVVSNPPHFGGKKSEWKGDLRIFDPGWNIHKEFYSRVRSFLNRYGSVIFVENEMGAGMDMWRPYIDRNGLELREIFKVGRLHGIARQAVTVYHTAQRVKGRNMSQQMGGTGSMIARMPKTLYYVCDYILSDPFYFVWSRKP